MNQRSAEQCAICGCKLHRDGEYAKPTVKGRSHATEHHYVAERFFGRSANRPGTVREPLFREEEWKLEKNTAAYCYECNEELIHNPVFLPEDIAAFAELVKAKGLSEDEKSDDRSKLAGRIRLLHEVIEAGLHALKKKWNRTFTRRHLWSTAAEYSPAEEHPTSLGSYHTDQLITTLYGNRHVY
jgi:hypothetical protein